MMASDENHLIPWAKRYGAMPNSHKSGLTPIEYLFPGQISAAKQKEIDQSVMFQQLRLYGFATRELRQLDALCTRDLVQGNLQNGIVPFLQRSCWEKVHARPDFHRAHLYPVKGGTGMWIADNDEVWTVLEPCVRVASQILMSTDLLPWVRNISWERK
jgi:hypothetical protein